MCRMPCNTPRIVTAIVCFFCSVFHIVSSSCPSPRVYLGNSNNGTKGTSYPQGTVLTYSCLIGFDPKDEFSKARICLIDGTWSGDDVVCTLNVFNFIISLLATVGVILVFIILVGCRISQRKRQSTAAMQRRQNSSKHSTTSTVQMSNDISPLQPQTTNLYESTSIYQKERANRLATIADEEEDDDGEMKGPPVGIPQRTSTREAVIMKGKSVRLEVPEIAADEGDGYKQTAKRNIPYTLANTPSYRKQGAGWVHDDASFDSYDPDADEEDDDGEGEPEYAYARVDVTARKH